MTMMTPAQLAARLARAMLKRRSSFSDHQMIFSFDVPAPARQAGDLAGLSAMMAASVARILKESPLDRGEIASRMSALLGEPVSKSMLDAYASEARAEFNISAARWWALIAVSERFDVADAIAQRAGARILSGDEIKAAELGSLQAEIDAMQARMKELRSCAAPLKRSRRQ
jgi:hypothetical protein